MATPQVSLALETPVNDQNYFRNGNFYSSFWKTPAGLSCPVGVETTNANYWSVNPNGAAVNSLRSTNTPDLYSLFTLQLVGAANVTDCSLAQQINGDLSAVLRRPCTVSGYIQNNSGSNVSPTFEIWTANAFNNFTTVTLQQTVNLQTCANAAWTYVSATIDLTSVTNVANGLFLKFRLPNGALSATAKTINFSRLKFQIGEVATEFVDDASLFVQTPSVDSTMLQDGCIARPSLFLPNVVPTGAYQAKSIQSADIGTGAVEAINLDPGIATTTAANFTVPAVNATVAITVTSVVGISQGLVLSIAGAGNYSTVSVAGSVVTATNLGSAGAASPGTIINSGASVTTTGNAVIGCLGYTPINKSGQTGIGPGALEFDNDDVVGANSYLGAGVILQSTAANQANDGFMPAISFNRPTVTARSIGLAVDGRLRTIDAAGVSGYMLDSVHGVDTNSYQDASITLQKLAQSLIDVLIPPGMVRMFGGPSIPAGWLVCDGRAVSRTTYAALYAAIGTYWGSGDNISTFNLPDFRGRTPLGYVNSPISGITSRGFASGGGEENHVLSTAELAYHGHGVTDNGHGHPGSSDTGHGHNINDPTHTHGGVVVTVVGNIAGTGNNVAAQYGQTGASGTGISIQTGHANLAIANAATGISIQANGSNAGHNNMSPFAVLYFIIKS